MISLENVNISSGNLSECDVENLKLLYTTPIGTIPLKRNVGVDFSIIGLPMEEAKNRYMINIINITNGYNPNLEVDMVEFETDVINGKIIPKVVISNGE